MKILKGMLLFTLMLSVQIVTNAQCCAVVSSNGLGAVSSNGICVVTAAGANMKCADAKDVDTDGDGVLDKDDACPAIAGLAATNGCPDGDADGVADNSDLCPEEAGLVENKGCPAVSDDENEILHEALHGVKFETGSDIITAESYPVLDNVVSLMNRKSMYNLVIDGHTDSQGDDKFNMELSKKRAIAVRKYLIDKGVTVQRISAFGFGETVPVGDNSTAEGRAENRRVELKVKF